MANRYQLWMMTKDRDIPHYCLTPRGNGLDTLDLTTTTGEKSSLFSIDYFTSQFSNLTDLTNKVNESFAAVGLSFPREKVEVEISYLVDQQIKILSPIFGQSDLLLFTNFLKNEKKDQKKDCGSSPYFHAYVNKILASVASGEMGQFLKGYKESIYCDAKLLELFKRYGELMLKPSSIFNQEQIAYDKRDLQFYETAICNVLDRYKVLRGLELYYRTFMECTTSLLDQYPVDLPSSPDRLKIMEGGKQLYPIKPSTIYIDPSALPARVGTR